MKNSVLGILSFLVFVVSEVHAAPKIFSGVPRRWLLASFAGSPSPHPHFSTFMIEVDDVHAIPLSQADFESTRGSGQTPFQVSVQDWQTGKTRVLETLDYQFYQDFSNNTVFELETLDPLANQIGFPNPSGTRIFKIKMSRLTQFWQSSVFKAEGEGWIRDGYLPRLAQGIAEYTAHVAGVNVTLNSCNFPKRIPISSNSAAASTIALKTPKKFRAITHYSDKAGRSLEDFLTQIYGKPLGPNLWLAIDNHRRTKTLNVDPVLQYVTTVSTTNDPHVHAVEVIMEPLKKFPALSSEKFYTSIQSPHTCAAELANL